MRYQHLPSAPLACAAQLWCVSERSWVRFRGVAASNLSYGTRGRDNSAAQAHAAAEALATQRYQHPHLYAWPTLRMAYAAVKRIGLCRCRANMAHIRQSRPDSGLGFQVNFLTIGKAALEHALSAARAYAAAEALAADRSHHPHRCRANLAHMRKSRPDSGLGFQVHFRIIEKAAFEHLLSTARAHAAAEALAAQRYQHPYQCRANMAHIRQ